jgi:hypothetical protein
MTTVPFTQCCHMLSVDSKTLRQWLKRSNLSLHQNPTDARIKCLTIEQVQQLATLHARPITPITASIPEPVPTSMVPSQTPTEEQKACLATPVQLENHLLPVSRAETELLDKLSSLEAIVATLQQQVTQLALELLNQRTLHYGQRLQTLEALVPPAEKPDALQTMEEVSQQEKGQNITRSLHPAELRARSRVLPLIEYGADAIYVLIDPKEGEVSFTPDSPEWFDWIASLSSFHFTGQSGRFTAYRGGSRLHPSRAWYAYRYYHQQN